MLCQLSYRLVCPADCLSAYTYNASRPGSLDVGPQSGTRLTARVPVLAGEVQGLLRLRHVPVVQLEVPGDRHLPQELEELVRQGHPDEQLGRPVERRPGTLTGRRLVRREQRGRVILPAVVVRRDGQAVAGQPADPDVVTVRRADRQPLRDLAAHVDVIDAHEHHRRVADVIGVPAGVDRPNPRRSRPDTGGRENARQIPLQGRDLGHVVVGVAVALRDVVPGFHPVVVNQDQLRPVAHAVQRVGEGAADGPDADDHHGVLPHERPGRLVDQHVLRVGVGLAAGVDVGAGGSRVLRHSTLLVLHTENVGVVVIVRSVIPVVRLGTELIGALMIAASGAIDPIPLISRRIVRTSGNDPSVRL